MPEASLRGTNPSGVEIPINVSAAGHLITDPGTPLVTAPVLGANNGSAAQAVADITDATVGANKVFSGIAHIAVSAQNPANTATGSVIVAITWVPGTSGSIAHRVATVNLHLPATAAAINGVSIAQAVAVPVVVYAGTTAGKFQAAVVVAGVITGLLWDVVVNGISQ